MLVIMALCGGEAAEARADAPVSASAAEKVVLAHYMPWYETPARGGGWGSHWTGPRRQHDPDKTNAKGLPDIWSHYHPLIGPYDSADAAVLECQLLQMRLAGIDGVIVDWYGIGPTADHPSIHEATRALFAQTRRLGMRFVACFEDRSIDLMVKRGDLREADVGAHLARTFAWMEREWFAAENYHRVGGRPLLLNFGPIYLENAEVWRGAFAEAGVRPAFFTLPHLRRVAGADGGFPWVHWPPWEKETEPARIKARLAEIYRGMGGPEEVIPSAYPGFNDIYDGVLDPTHRELAHRDGATLRESLEVCLEGPWPLAQLITWNDYGEGTMIEPTHEFGYLFLEIIQELRKPAGLAPEDLRLPARLLALRRAGAVEGEKLDEIAQALAAGRVAEARAMLEVAEGRR